MKKLILSAAVAALLAAALTGCVDNTSNGGLEGAPYNNSGINGTASSSDNGSGGLADSDSL